MIRFLRNLFVLLAIVALLGGGGWGMYKAGAKATRQQDGREFGLRLLDIQHYWEQRAEAEVAQYKSAAQSPSRGAKGKSVLEQLCSIPGSHCNVELPAGHFVVHGDAASLGRMGVHVHGAGADKTYVRGEP